MKKKLSILLFFLCCLSAKAVEWNLTKGWNMLSSPEELTADSISAQIPCSIYVYKDNNYIKAEGGMKIQSLEGFWLYSEEDAVLRVSGSQGGTPYASRIGWNLMGVGSMKTLTSSESKFYWGWELGSYENPRILHPTKAYWYFYTRTTNVIPGPPGPPGVPFGGEHLQINMRDLDWLNSPEIKLLKSSITKADVGLGNISNVDTTDASNLMSGVVHSSRLPIIPVNKLPNGIPASKITGLPASVDVTNLQASYIKSGTVDTDRLPVIPVNKLPSGIPASKITGLPDGVDVTNLQASYIKSGTFEIDRIPTLTVSKLPGSIPESNLATGIPASKITGLPDITNLAGSSIKTGTVNTDRLNIVEIKNRLGFTSYGFEVPKMTTDQRLSVPPNEVEGRLIYDTDVKSLMRGNEAGFWIKIN